MPTQDSSPRCALAVAALMVFAARPAAAQNESPPATPPEHEPAPTLPATPETISEFDFTVTPSASFRYIFEADLEDEGSVAVSRTGFGVLVNTNPAEGFQLDFDLDAELSFYDFGGDAEIVPGFSEPFSELYGVQFNVRSLIDLGDDWGLVLGGILRVAGEPDADVADSIYGGGYTGLGYQFSRQFFFAVGAGVVTRIEDDPRVIPFIRGYWLINERVRLIGEGIGLAIAVDLNDQWTMTTGARYETREYRLDDEGAYPDGVARDDSVPLNVELAWRPDARLRLAFEAGAIVYQEFELLDENGRNSVESETDPAFFLGVRLSLRF